MDNIIIKNILNFVNNENNVNTDTFEHYGGKAAKRKSKSKKMKKKQKKKKQKKDEGEEAEEAEEGEGEYSETSEEDYEEDDESPGFFSRLFGFKSSKSSNRQEKLKNKLIRLSKEIYENENIISSILEENPELTDFVNELQKSNIIYEN